MYVDSVSCKGSFLEMECDRPNIFCPDLAIWKIRFGNLHSFKKLLLFQIVLQEQDNLTFKH